MKSTEKDIRYYNKLIAEFMGGVFNVFFYQFPIEFGWKEHWDEGGFLGIGTDTCWSVEELQYHSNWDGWLMPVVEKIETMGYRVHIIEDYCEIYEKTNTTIPFIKCCSYPKRKATWEAVAKFVELYNEQGQK